MNETYLNQVKLLLRVLPIIGKEDSLAIKGGTAINLFFRDMPRLSVDIDLTYLPIADRESSLQDITNILNRIKDDIKKTIPRASVNTRKLSNTEFLSGLLIQGDGVHVKVEVNTTIRGSVHPPVKLSLSNKASELFEMDVEILSLSFEDVYAGKICAALDRQHPRDFYDIKLLLENEGISDKLRKTLIAYLISNNRPIVELLNPNLIDIANVFNQEFSGMTMDNVSIEELIKSRDELIDQIHSSISDDDINFLLSFKSKTPKWELLGLDGVENLPSIRWKMLNLDRMSKNKHAEVFDKLQKFLNTLRK